MVSSRKIDACNLVVDEINNSGGEALACECNISSKEALQNLANFSENLQKLKHFLSYERENGKISACGALKQII